MRCMHVCTLHIRVMAPYLWCGESPDADSRGTLSTYLLIFSVRLKQIRPADRCHKTEAIRLNVAVVCRLSRPPFSLSLVEPQPCWGSSGQPVLRTGRRYTQIGILSMIGSAAPRIGRCVCWHITTLLASAGSLSWFVPESSVPSLYPSRTRAPLLSVPRAFCGFHSHREAGAGNGSCRWP